MVLLLLKSLSSKHNEATQKVLKVHEIDDRGIRCECVGAHDNVGWTAVNIGRPVVKAMRQKQ
eukprot:2277045-Amphidinium_carterae.2